MWCFVSTCFESGDRGSGQWGWRAGPGRPVPDAAMGKRKSKAARRAAGGEGEAPGPDAAAEPPVPLAAVHPACSAVAFAFGPSLVVYDLE